MSSIQRSMVFALALTVASASTALAQSPLDGHVKTDYQQRSNAPRASVMPRKLGAGVYQSPNGTAITNIITIAKPAAGVMDGITRMGYYSADENTYWVHVTGGIAGFNYWEGPFTLGGTAASQTMNFSVYSTGQNSNGAAAETFVLREPADWVAAAKSHNKLNNIVEPDFGDDTAFAIFMGQKSSGGYSVAVDEISKDSTGTIVVKYSESSPAPGTNVTNALTSPYVIVTIPRTLDPVRFEKSVAAPVVAPLSFTSLSRGDTTGISSAQAQNVILATQADLDTFWSQHAQGTKPTVDFAKETVIALLMGSRNSAGFEVKVSGVKRTGPGQIEVKATYKSPAPGSMNATVQTHPYEIIKVNSAGDTISFNISGANTANYEFTDIIFKRSRPADAELDQLTITANGDVALRVFDSNGQESQAANKTFDDSKLTMLSDMLNDADYYNIVNPARVRGFQPDPKLQSFRAEIADLDRSLSHVIAYNTTTTHSPDYQGVHDELVRIIDSMRKTKPVNTAGFDLIELVDRSEVTGGFRVERVVLKSDGSIERTLTAPTIKTAPQIGKVSAADLKNIGTLYAATDFMNQNFPIIQVQKGTPLTLLSAKLGSNFNTSMYPTGSPLGQKSAEVGALATALRALQLVKPKLNFDTLIYSQTLNGFVGETKSVTIHQNGDVSWVNLKNGRPVSNENGTLTTAEIDDLNKAFLDADFMNQTFPPYQPRAGSRDSNIQASAGGKTAEFPHAQGMVSGPKAFELLILESKLEAILKRHKPTPATFETLNYKLTMVSSGEQKELTLTGDTVNWTVSAAKGATPTPAQTGSFKVTAADLANLQKLYADADFQSLPKTIPSTIKRMVASENVLTVTEKGKPAKSVSSSDTANETKEYDAFRSAVEDLFKQVVITKMDVILANINIITDKSNNSTWIVTTKTSTMTVTGPKQKLLEGLAGRWGRLEGVIKGREFELNRVITPEQIVVKGQMNAGEDKFVSDKVTYDLYGRMNDVLRKFRGQDTSVRAWLYNNTQLEVIGVFATATENSWGIPFAYVAKGETLEITQDFGKLVQINVSDGTSGETSAGIKLDKLAPRVVVKGSTNGITKKLQGLIK